MRTASLHTKLMLALAVVVLATAAVSVTVLTNQERERRMRELEARADRIASLFSRSLAPTLWTVDLGAVQGQLEALAPNPEVVHFRVTTPGQGTVGAVVRQPAADLSKAVVLRRPIVYTPRGRYVIAVLTQDVPADEASRLIAHVSRVVFDRLAS